MRTNCSRRKFIAAAAGIAASGCGRGVITPSALRPAVAVLRAPNYNADLLDIMMRGAELCGLNVRGKRVLLKPNLVEFAGHTCINTNAAVVAAAAQLFEKLGAAEVRIGEGPGHRRDTLYLAEEAGYFEAIPRFEERFVDLNRDDVSPVPGFLKDKDLYLPKTALGAELVVSLPKMKTHHWAGATLSMKNFFGVVPGAVYGWPKNPLHYAGIDHSIVELTRIFRRSFAIVDGVVGMEGNGPIQGSPKQAGVIVMGSDLVSVDATCCRLMGIDPEKVAYLRMARDLGQIDPARIDQRGEAIAAAAQRFLLIDEFKHLRLS